MSTPDVLTTDICILGAGMAGASLVQLLRPARAAGIKITLIDRQPLSWNSSADERPPSFDGRATALSYGTKDILASLGLWDAAAPHACAIEHIQVSDSGHFGQTHMHAEEQGTEALGYVIENHRLGQALLTGLREDDTLALLAPADVTRVQMVPAGAALTLADGRSLQCRLLIMADGGRSDLPRQLGIHHQSSSYGATALVTRISTSEAHNNWAYERFREDGPLALLPLDTQDFAVVWTLQNDEVSDIMALPDAELLARLQAQIGYRCGRFTRIGERLTYPLALVKSTEQVRRSLVLLGNAAHTLHPVAGQGFNLTLRDAAVLAEHLNKAVSEGRNPGDLEVLQGFARTQIQDQRNTILASDWLPRLFSSKEPAVSVLRNAGLIGMTACPPVRQMFTRHAMGLGQTRARTE
ncbi:MAG TPA: 2-octaprenyl-6-methoxyphenyl hydroxylase [Oceanospirillales bacterium]|nr:2-octaprenyl-6-methoxyphenyl hydroxylase [Oceanospirillaceae bacterium]HBS41125.1 2-octaprenyl-6-methoxyphenyl hydroxylase [Oceanospirillales bacterium]|tara:strand:+ start:429 stop:1661 length:1233 start_codon:yes stop_codon:yes gene_type:complete